MSTLVIVDLERGREKMKTKTKWTWHSNYEIVIFIFLYQHTSDIFVKIPFRGLLHKTDWKWQDFPIKVGILEWVILQRETFSCFQGKKSTPSLKCSSKVGLMPSCCPGNKALSGKQWGDWCSPIGCLGAWVCEFVCVCARVGGTGCLAVRGEEQTDMKRRRRKKRGGQCGCPNTIV